MHKDDQLDSKKTNHIDFLGSIECNVSEMKNECNVGMRPSQPVIFDGENGKHETYCGGRLYYVSKDDEIGKYWCPASDAKNKGKKCYFCPITKSLLN